MLFITSSDFLFWEVGLLPSAGLFMAVGSLHFVFRSDSIPEYRRRLDRSTELQRGGWTGARRLHRGKKRPPGLCDWWECESAIEQSCTISTCQDFYLLDMFKVEDRLPLWLLTEITTGCAFSRVLLIRVFVRVHVRVRAQLLWPHLDSLWRHGGRFDWKWAFWSLWTARAHSKPAPLQHLTKQCLCSCTRAIDTIRPPCRHAHMDAFVWPNVTSTAAPRLFRLFSK